MRANGESQGGMEQCGWQCIPFKSYTTSLLSDKMGCFWLCWNELDRYLLNGRGIKPELMADVSTSAVASSLGLLIASHSVIFDGLEKREKKK